jgi:cell division protein FtsQ
MPRVAAAPRAALRTPAKPPPPLQARRPSRLALIWRRRRRLVLPAIGVAALLAVFVMLASLLRSLQPGNTVASLPERLGLNAGLTVRDIRIEGRQKTPEDFLRAALGVSRGDKLMNFSLDAARARIEKLTWVQHATVERRLPGTIIVKLEERRPFAVWQSEGKFHLIDREGQVVVEQDPTKDADAFQKLPLVVGAGAPEHAAALLDQLAALPSLRDRVAAAVRIGERRWNLHLSNGIDVLLPEVGQAAALEKLMELQTSQTLLDRPLQLVDMRLPDRFVVRPIGDPKPAPPPGRKPA